MKIKYLLPLAFIAIAGVSAQNGLAEEKKDSKIAAENKGKIFFTTQPTGRVMRQSPSNTEGETYIQEYELGEPLYARAFYDKPEALNELRMRYTINSETFSEEDMREYIQTTRIDNIASRLIMIGYGGTPYYVADETAAIPLVSAPEKYFEMYAMQEMAFRMLLARQKDKIKVGDTFTLKVELYPTKRSGNERKELDNSPAVATGELKVKVTNNSKNFANMLCRCGDAGMSDANVEKDIMELFQDKMKDVCAKVYFVNISDRDYQIDRNGRSGQIECKYVTGTVVWEAKDGTYWICKNYYRYLYDGSNYSEKADWGKMMLFTPVPKICTEAKSVAAASKGKEEKKEDKKAKGKGKS